MIEILNDLSIFLIPFLIGSLVFFSSIVAPNTFINLDEKNTRKFIRTLFPKIYTYAAILSLLIAIFLLKVEVFYSFIFFCNFTWIYILKIFFNEKN